MAKQQHRITATNVTAVTLNIHYLNTTKFRNSNKLFGRELDKANIHSKVAIAKLFTTLDVDIILSTPYISHITYGGAIARSIIPLYFIN